MAKARKVRKVKKAESRKAEPRKAKPKAKPAEIVERIPGAAVPTAIANVMAQEPDGPDVTLPAPKPEKPKKKPKLPTRPPRPQKTRRSSAKYADDPTEPNRCHAARKTDGKRCGSPSSEGMAVCYVHGGKSVGGNVIHGGYSRVLMKRKAQIYEAAKSNEAMLYDMGETLALSHVILVRAIERAEECDVPMFRTRATDMLDEAFELGAKGDSAGMAAQLKELQRLLISGVKEDKALRHMTDAIDTMAAQQKEAWGVRLKAGQVMNERDITLWSARIIDIAIKTFGVKDAARFAQAIDRESL